jgi:DNA-binding winged helix-turn-helix (wHTH) protein/MoxR-like ATPase
MLRAKSLAIVAAPACIVRAPRKRAAMIFTFGPFELDDIAGEVRCAGELIAMQPRVRNVLCYLIEHRDRVVSRQELIAIFWNGQRVNRSAVPWTIGHARRALTAHAPPGRLIETVRQRGYRFVGTVRQRHIEQPVLERAVPPSDAARGSELPFVGRGALMSELRSALEASYAGNGEMLVLSGEAGIGKTRAATELALRARSRGIQPWCASALDGARAFGHFGQVLRDARDDASISAVESELADDLLSALCSAGPDAGQRDHFWLSDRISSFIAGTAQIQPRYIQLDDLHRADEGSLRVLDLLMPLLRRSRLLVIATARDAVLEPSELPAHALVSRYRECAQARLPSLPYAEVARCLRHVLGADASDALSRAVHAKTTGNPLFLSETASFLRSRQQRGLALAAADVAIPQAAREQIFTRVATLAPSTRLLLDAAASMGEELDVPALTSSTELTIHEALHAMDEALVARVLIPVQRTPRYSFASPLMRAVLHEAKLSWDTRRHEHPPK